MSLLAGFSLGAIAGSLVSSTLMFIAAHKLREREQKRQNFFNLATRFDSKETLEARVKADKICAKKIGRPFKDLYRNHVQTMDDSLSMDPVWIVLREFEFLALSLEEKIVDERLAVKHFCEVYIYWLQYIRFGYQDMEHYNVDRHFFLEDFFKNHPLVRGKFCHFEARARVEISKQIKGDSFDYDGATIWRERLSKFCRGQQIDNLEAIKNRRIENERSREQRIARSHVLK